MHRSAALVLALVLAPPCSTLSEPPSDIAYQGQLLAANGLPLPGPVNIQVRIYENAAPVGGEIALFVEDHFLVPLEGGVFTLLIGQGTPVSGAVDPDLFSAPDRYLEVYVNGERLEPRQAISSVPYALHAASLGGLSAAEVSDGIRALHVVDGATQDFGILTDDHSGRAAAYNEALDLIVELSVFSGDVNYAKLYFDASNCQGQAWTSLFDSSSSSLPYLARAPTGFQEPYIRTRATGVRASSTQYASRILEGGAVAGCEDGVFSENLTAPADGVAAAALGFTLPATLPISLDLR